MYGPRSIAAWFPPLRGRLQDHAKKLAKFQFLFSTIHIKAKRSNQLALFSPDLLATIVVANTFRIDKVRAGERCGRNRLPESSQLFRTQAIWSHMIVYTSQPINKVICPHLPLGVETQSYSKLSNTHLIQISAQ
ncbi:hypothetical protein HanXRQr2_Chr07g0300381 [Helianthus annuus]|uniref:Uncharacterized protein n=1 Tax=Helianthus annuus TaxID=4232 RepID=A0A251UB13_HELAN|nr:hypothetical protein HanXRQr2_Chr07g0300381 [Helianthus annuus]